MTPAPKPTILTRSIQDPTMQSALPRSAPRPAPEFADPASAKAWLQHVPLANVAAAQRQLLAQVEEFNRFGSPAPNRLATLEALREAVHFVQIEQARRFINRALPMAETEGAVFADTLALWEQMRLGYLRCVDAIEAKEPGLRGQGALACQRALALGGLKMFHFHRAYRQVPKQEWRALHQTYARAEALKAADTPVKDYLNRDVHDTSPRIAYVRALLMGMANPNELSQRQLTFVAFLLERWSEKVGISAHPIVEEVDTPPLIVDLEGESSPERGGPKAGQPRYLDTQRISKSLRSRIGLLRKGESPARLGLGEDCVQPSCEQLLVFLYRQWCQTRQPRASERKRVSEVAQVCNDMAAVHYYVSGKAFRQPEQAQARSMRQSDELAAFGHVRSREDDAYGAVQGFQLEPWRLLDESALGLKMMRSASTPGKRYMHGQLVAVRPADAKGFMLAQVRWLSQSEEGDLYAGVRLLPGLPAAAAVRASGLNARDSQYVQALSLTAVAALNSPPALVLPAGWYKPKRVLDVHIDSAVQVELAEVLERGSDFERVSYGVL
jgi:hypothetical protein